MVIVISFFDVMLVLLQCGFDLLFVMNLLLQKYISIGCFMVVSVVGVYMLRQRQFLFMLCEWNIMLLNSGSCMQCGLKVVVLCGFCQFVVGCGGFQCSGLSGGVVYGIFRNLCSVMLLMVVVLLIRVFVVIVICGVVFCVLVVLMVVSVNSFVVSWVRWCMEMGEDMVQVLVVMKY